ncbi:MAG: copper homeostasis protein CutC [Gemmataceae bacterium]
MTSQGRILLEVAVASVQDALTSRDGGADRLELNAALALGGLTPTLGMLREVREAVTLPIIVLARPRAGGFCYNASEFRVLLRDIDLALEHGAEGIAFGVLTAEGTIDHERCWQIIRLIGTREAVFHRAFDVTPDPVASLEQLIDLGVKRVMTSGQEETAYQGAACIRRLRKQAQGRVEVLPAGGINRFTVADVLARTGCDQIHASLRTSRPDPSTVHRPQVRFNASHLLPDDRFETTSPDAVRELRAMTGGPAD